MAKPVTSQVIPDLTGCSRRAACELLWTLGFFLNSETKGGYRKYSHVDGSQVWIKANGDVVRLGPKVTPRGGGKKYRPRFNQRGQRTQSHDTGETLE